MDEKPKRTLYGVEIVHPEWLGRMRLVIPSRWDRFWYRFSSFMELCVIVLFAILSAMLLASGL